MVDDVKGETCPLTFCTMIFFFKLLSKSNHSHSDENGAYLIL